MRKTAKILLAAAALSALVATSTAVAGSPKSSSSITLVVLSSERTAEAAPQQGDQVTFEISTNAERPYVLLNCYQGGTWIYAGQAPFWGTLSRSFTLATTAWTSGGAECTARLGSLNADGTRFRELATTSFAVAG